MSKFDEIKEAIAIGWPAVPSAALSIRLLDFVVKLPEAETRLMTIPMLANGIGHEEIDGDLLTAITILVSSSLSLLQPRAMFIEEGEEEFELGPADLSAARQQGVLAHPQTGEAIADFETKLYPFFVPTARLKAIMQTEHGT